MALTFDCIDPTSNPNYDKWITKFENSTIFHSSNWAATMKSSYDYTPFNILARQNGVIKCILPIMEIRSFLTGKRAVALPFTDYCEPLTENKDILAQVLEYIYSIGQKRNWQSVEIRGGEKHLGDQTEYKTYYRHLIRLNQDANSIFNSFRSSTRRNIKKAISMNVKTDVTYEYGAVKKFYELNCLTRKKHGLPPQPFTFFENIYKNIISQKKGYSILANVNNKIVAGGIFFNFNDKVLYKYGASDPSHFNTRANNLVMWHAIRKSSEDNYKEFCFGRTEKDNAGLIQFKEGYGTIKTKITYYKYDLKSNKYISKNINSGSQLISNQLRRFPVFILKGIGKILYKHVG